MECLDNASQFGVPVVANNKNLTRKLVKYYHLGILLDDISSIGLCDFFNSLLKTKVYRVSDKYAKVNNVDTFHTNNFKLYINYG